MANIERYEKFRNIKIADGTFRTYQKVRKGQEHFWILVSSTDVEPDEWELSKKTQYAKRSHLTERQRNQIETLLYWGVSVDSAAKFFKVTYSTVQGIKNRKVCAILENEV